MILLAETANHGFAGANNLAARRARGEYLLLLNPDTLVLDGAVDRLLAFARANPRAGIWGGRTLYGDRSLNPASCWGRMTLWNLFCRASGLTGVFPRSELFNSEAYGGWDRGSERAVDIVTGCFLMIRRETWEALGGFDPAFFMYGEEADLCLRARALGAAPRVTPEAEIVHYGGAADTVRADKMVRLLSGKISLIDRHFPAWQRPLARGLFARLAAVADGRHPRARRRHGPRVHARLRRFLVRDLGPPGRVARGLAHGLTRRLTCEKGRAAITRPAPPDDRAADRARRAQIAARLRRDIRPRPPKPPQKQKTGRRQRNRRHVGEFERVVSGRERDGLEHPQTADGHEVGADPGRGLDRRAVDGLGSAAARELDHQIVVGVGRPPQEAERAARRPEIVGRRSAAADRGVEPGGVERGALPGAAAQAADRAGHVLEHRSGRRRGHRGSRKIPSASAPDRSSRRPPRPRTRSSRRRRGPRCRRNASFPHSCPYPNSLETPVCFCSSIRQTTSCSTSLK